MKLLWPLIICAGPSFADTCPPVPDPTDQLEVIYDELNGPDGEFRHRFLTAALWEIWTNAPDAKAQALLDEGMRLRESFDLTGARAVLDDLIAYCPDYAEGYNQRAFASFLGRDFESALTDLNAALEILPNHVAALAGKGLTLLGMGRDVEAQEALRAAVGLNPWLSERRLLTAPPGKDI